MESLVTASEPIDFKKLFEAVPGLHLAFWPDLTICAASDAYLRVTNAKRSDLLGRKLADLFPGGLQEVERNRLNNLRQSVARVFESGIADTMAVQRVALRRPGSAGGGLEERYWSPANIPVPGPGGYVQFVIHRIEDVTESIRLQKLELTHDRVADELRGRAERSEVEVLLRARELSDAKRALELVALDAERLRAGSHERDEIRSSFFARLNHELRAPLVRILGPAERLLCAEDIDPSLADEIAAIGRNGRLALRHVEDLLDLAKIDTGRMAMRYAATDLGALLLAAVARFELAARERRIALAVDVAGTVGAELDAEKVQRIVLGLLSHALRSTPDGGRIACSLAVGDGNARLVVEDSGAALPPDRRERLFEPFARHAEDGRRPGGDSLDLSIAKAFTTLHGGAIAVEEGTLGGVRLAITLPLRAPDGVAVQPAPDGGRPFAEWQLRQAVEAGRPEAPRAGTATGGRPTVLVVMGDRDRLAGIAAALADTYRVTTARDGLEGLVLAVDDEPDLVLCDVTTPDAGGTEFLQAIRRDRRFDEVPFVPVCDGADAGMRVALLRQGAQDCLVAPFATEELRARLANLVAIRALRRALSLREHVSEETRRGLIREARDAILVVDNDERVVEANHAAATLCGGDPCGRHLGDLFDLDGDAVEAAGGAVMRRGRLRDTADRLVEVSAARLAPGADGLGLVIIRDVTERVTLEEQVKQSRHMAAIGKLTGGIAHDFNNILTVVSGTVDLMDDKVGNHPEMATMVRIIERAAERGAQLTQRMLAFAGRQQLHPEEIAPDDIVSRMAAILKRTIGDDIKVQTVVGERVWRAFADPAQIEDALLNLAVNARDAMPKGGTLTIETMNAHLDEAYAQRNDDVAPGDYVAIVVTDSGVGMTPEIMARAFEPFFTTKESGHGTGLGLSMVYGFVRQSGGHVTIHSELGRGTSVKLYLPRAKATAAVAEPAAAAAAADALPPRAAGDEAVLVVEDDPAVRGIVRDMLADLGYSVTVAADGPEALAAIDSQRPIDVLFTDLIMPNGMSGYDLYAAARKRRPGLKVIFTSGYSETLLGARDATSRDVPLLGKPYRRQKLAEMMRRILDRPSDV